MELSISNSVSWKNQETSFEGEEVHGNKMSRLDKPGDREEINSY